MFAIKAMLLLPMLGSAFGSSPSSSSQDQTDPASAARELLRRVLPSGRDAEFDVVILPMSSSSSSSPSPDHFRISNGDGARITLTGHNAVGVASALNWYLKYVSHNQVSWNGDQLHLAQPLPRLESDIVRNRSTTFSYYLNVCTLGYSAPWWDWARWERELDWMALNGVNLPLAFTGQELVWQRTFRAFNLTDSDLNAFFSGAAFLPWQRMGNIRGWGGPLPQYYIETQSALQTKILSRLRSLGMTAVLPAFGGHIPEALIQKYPSMKYTRSKAWSRFDEQYTQDYYVANEDPMFAKVGEEFLHQQTLLYGTDHFYCADQYNEMQPASADPTLITAASAAMIGYMVAADPKATWVMQSWMWNGQEPFWTPELIQAYLSGVPKERHIVLDLGCDQCPVYSRTESFYGHSYVWNMIQNYGGNPALYGKLQSINTIPYEAMVNTTIVGMQ